MTAIPVKTKTTPVIGGRMGRFGALLRGAPLRLLTWVVAYGFAYPLRVGVGLGVVGLVSSGWNGMVGAICAVASAAAWQWLAMGILRRSLRDPLQLNPLVKSLRLRSRVRRRWSRAMHDAGLEKPTRGGEPVRPRPKRIRLTPVGVRTRVNVGAVSATPEGFRAKRANLESKFGAVGSRVQEVGPGWVQLDLRHTDPLNRKITTADLPKSTRRGFVVVGIDEDGHGVEKELRLPSLLIGAQGSGKSTEIWTTLNALLRGGIPFRLRTFDPKGGQEFTELADVSYVYERDPLKWPDFLGRGLGALLTRQHDLARQGIRNLRWYTDENPLDILVIDELVTVAAFKSKEVVYHDADGRHTLKAGEAHMLFLSQARSAGFTEIACTQLGQKAVLGPEIMDLYGYRTCLRVGSDELVDVILGPGSAKQYPAHLLPQDERYAGIGYVDTRSKRGVVKYRAAMLSEAERRWTIRQLGVQKDRQERAAYGRRAS